MPRILHLADLHLDSPLEALAPQKALARRAEMRESLGRVIEAANEDGVELILAAGDLFDRPSIYYETVSSVAAAFARFRGRVFVAPGNHDFYAPGSPYAAVAWSQNVHIFRRLEIECVELPSLGCRVYGAGFISPRCDKSLLSGFRAEPGAVNIMVLHAELAPVDTARNPVSEKEIEASGLDFLALGHYHEYSGIRHAGKTAYAYSGCLEGRGFDEKGQKGYITGEIGPAGAALDFVPFARRRYEELTADITGAGPEELAVRVLAALPDYARDGVFRIILTGDAEESAPDTAALERALTPHTFSVSVRDRTTLARDIWAEAGKDNPVGLFLTRMKERLDAAKTPEDRKTVELAVRFGLAALENREAAL